jgi:hypothetical protein
MQQTSDIIGGHHVVRRKPTASRPPLPSVSCSVCRSRRIHRVRSGAGGWAARWRLRTILGRRGA